VGAPSNEAAATPEAAATVPGSPGNAHATAGALKVKLTWVAPAWNGGSAVTGYNVYEGTVSGGESATPVNSSPLSATATSYAATGLANGTKYFFILKAINAIGTSAASSEVSALPT
jgi:predicted phage tail protein